MQRPFLVAYPILELLQNNMFSLSSSALLFSVKKFFVVLFMSWMTHKRSSSPVLAGRFIFRFLPEEDGFSRKLSQKLSWPTGVNGGSCCWLVLFDRLSSDDAGLGKLISGMLVVAEKFDTVWYSLIQLVTFSCKNWSWLKNLHFGKVWAAAPDFDIASRLTMQRLRFSRKFFHWDFKKLTQKKHI